MDDLAPILALLPDDWRGLALDVIALLIGLRSTLYVLVKTCHALDMRDGREDWLWVGTFGDWLQRVDRRFLSWLPVKAPFVRGDP